MNTDSMTSVGMPAFTGQPPRKAKILGILGACLTLVWLAVGVLSFIFLYLRPDLIRYSISPPGYTILTRSPSSLPAPVYKVPDPSGEWVTATPDKIGAIYTVGGATREIEWTSKQDQEVRNVSKPGYEWTVKPLAGFIILTDLAIPWLLFRMFVLMSKGQFFSLALLKVIRNLGAVAILLWIRNILLLFTAHWTWVQEGYRFVSVGTADLYYSILWIRKATHHVGFFLLGLGIAMFLFGWAFSKGKQLEEEAEATI